MSEYPPPAVPGDVALPAPEGLTPQAVEAVLADFRSWLQQLAVPSTTEGNGQSPGAAEPPDLHTLLSQLIALRQEVNLQTRASRTQQEQNAEALRQLGQAVDLLRQEHVTIAPVEHPTPEEVQRPLLKTLLDVYDALALASREVQRVQTALLPALEQMAAAGPPPAPPAPAESQQPPRPSLFFWARWLGAERVVHQALAACRRSEAALREAYTTLQQQQAADLQRQAQAAQAAARVRQLVTPLVTGYTMSVQRIERALQQHGLEPITAVGQPFDPELMEAVEVVQDSSRGFTEVIEEVRRGYLWRGRVFRYAQVRVAKP